MHINNLKILLLLLLVSLFWGLGYPLMKITLLEIPVFTVLWIRFLFAALLMIPILKLKYLHERKLLISGVILGTTLFFSFALIILGLERTTATSTGFLSALFILWVPLLSTLFMKQSLQKNTLISIPVSLLGIFYLFDMQISILHEGELLVMSGSLLTAIHILLIEKYSKHYSSMELTFVQFLVVTVWSILLSLVSYHSISIGPVSHQFIIAMIVVVVFSTLLAFWIQTKYQSYISPTQAALIFNTEPLFSTLFAVLLLHEVLEKNIYIGGLLIMLSLFISQKQK